MDEDVIRAEGAFVIDQRKFNDWLKILGNLDSDVVFHMTANGLEVHQLDETRIAMFYHMLPKGIFNEWYVSTEGYFMLNINDTRKAVFLKEPSKDDTLVVVTITKDLARFIKLSDGDNREVYVGLPYPREPNGAKVPILATVECELKLKEIIQELNDAKKAGFKELIVKCLNNTLTLTSINHYSGTKVTTDYRCGFGTLLNINCHENTESAYEINNLLKYIFIRTMLRFTDTCKISLGNETPIKAVFPNKYNIVFEHYLAPMIM